MQSEPLLSPTRSAFAIAIGLLLSSSPSFWRPLLSLPPISTSWRSTHNSWLKLSFHFTHLSGIWISGRISSSSFFIIFDVTRWDEYSALCTFGLVICRPGSILRSPGHCTCGIPPARPPLPSPGRRVSFRCPEFVRQKNASSLLLAGRGNRFCALLDGLEVAGDVPVAHGVVEGAPGGLLDVGCTHNEDLS